MAWATCRYCQEEFWMGEGWAYHSRIAATGQRVNFCRYNHQIAWEKEGDRRPGERKTRRKVKCLETGQLYPTAARAEQAECIDANGIRVACRTGKSYRGHHWAYVEEQP